MCLPSPQPPSKVGHEWHVDDDAISVGLHDVTAIFVHNDPPAQPATVVCKMEAQLEYVHFMFIKSALLVGCTASVCVHLTSIFSFWKMKN